MKHLVALVAALAAIGIVSSCRGSDVVNPPTGPGTAYPCGVWGVECPGDSCCPQGHICGGHRGHFTSCPEGYCCYRGDPWPGASLGDAGVDGGGEFTSIVPARSPR